MVVVEEGRWEVASPRTRPGVLKDPGPPWVEAVTVGYVAAGAPRLVVPTLHADDGVDGITVSFLLAWNLKSKEEEEKERRRKRKKAEHVASMVRLSDRACAGEPLTADEHAALRRWMGLPPKEPRRKRKKRRRKRRLPKSSSARSSHLDTRT